MSEEQVSLKNLNLFHIHSHVMLIQKLTWNYKVFIEASGADRGHIASPYFTAVYAAYDFAITAWHLTDWAYQIRKESGVGNLGGLLDFQKALAKEHRCLEVCEQLANCAKHRKRHFGKDNKDVRATVEFEANAFRAGSSRAGDALTKPAFFVVYRNNNVPAEEIFLEALNFWMHCAGLGKFEG